MSTSISKWIECDTAHRVKTHDGQCKLMHGHRYRFEVTLLGKVPESGMIVDFGKLKRAMLQRIGVLDHSTVLAHDDELVPILEAAGQRVVKLHGPPTAENLAEWAAAMLAAHEYPVSVIARVEVQETPSSKACWTNDKAAALLPLVEEERIRAA